MNRYKSIFGLVAGLMLAGSLFGYTALAQPPESSSSDNTTDVQVQVTDSGVFNAFFCTPGGAASTLKVLTTDSNPTASSAGSASGQLAICYQDTKTYRPSFDTTISAGAFTGGPSTIPLSGFKIVNVYNVLQTQWGATPDIGDIGQFVNEAYVGQGAPWPKAWTSSNTLDSSRKLQFGYAGIGTIASLGAFDVSLVLPQGTQNGTYTSLMTLSIIAGTQP
jgi:hypothetical protein